MHEHVSVSYVYDEFDGAYDVRAEKNKKCDILKH